MSALRVLLPRFQQFAVPRWRGLREKVSGSQFPEVQRISNRKTIDNSLGRPEGKLASITRFRQSDAAGNKRSCSAMVPCRYGSTCCIRAANADKYLDGASKVLTTLTKESAIPYDDGVLPSKRTSGQAIRQWSGHSRLTGFYGHEIRITSGGATCDNSAETTMLDEANGPVRPLRAVRQLRACGRREYRRNGYRNSLSQSGSVTANQQKWKRSCRLATCHVFPGHTN